MGIDIKNLKGFKIKGLEKEYKEPRMCDVVIFDRIGNFMANFQRNVSEERAINLAKRARHGVDEDKTGDYVVSIVYRDGKP